LRGAHMPYLPNFANVAFNSEVTNAMSQAFELAITQLPHDPPPVVQECMADRILEAARNGELDVRRMRDAALTAPPLAPH
jgi:hypothetical protein